MSCVVLAVFIAACGSAPDEQAPDLEVDLPGIQQDSSQILRTNVAVHTITGVVEPGATLQVVTTADPQPAPETGELDEAGRLTWSAEITLAEGVNQLTVTASDSAGNMRIVRRTIVLDIKPPRVSEWFFEEADASARLVIIFDELVKVDTLVKAEDDPSPRFTLFDAEGVVVPVVVPGVLEPRLPEGAETPEFWRSFVWTPDDSWMPTANYHFSIPPGIADELGNATLSEIIETFP